MIRTLFWSLQTSGTHVVYITGKILIHIKIKTSDY